MSKRIVILVLILTGFQGLFAQEKMNYAESDLQSFALFQDKNWKGLIEYSTEVRKHGIDYFYLQVRTGIAWYHLEKYRTASEWFLKAWQMDNSMEWLQEYVYFSLTYSGREMEALKYAQYFSDAIKAKIGYKESAISGIAYETGYSFNPDFDELKSYDFSTEINLGSDYGELYLLKDYSFHSFDLVHRVKPNLSLMHNLTYVGVNREAIVDWDGQSNSDIRINQFNYYISPTWIVGKKLNISPSLSLILGSGDVYAGGLTNNLSKAFSISKSVYSGAVMSTAVWSDFGNFSPGIEVNAAKINESKFVQFSSWVTYYPLGNINLHITPRVYFKSENATFGWNAFGISGGAKLGSVHLTGQYIFGDMENFVESNGYLVSNFTGITNNKMMGSIYFPLGKRYQFVCRFINQQMSERYQVYTSGIKSYSMEYNYSKYTLTGGISWRF